MFRIRCGSAAGSGASSAPADAVCSGSDSVRCGSAASDSQADIHLHNESSRFLPPFAVDVALVFACDTSLCLAILSESGEKRA